MPLSGPSPVFDDGEFVKFCRYRLLVLVMVLCCVQSFQTFWLASVNACFGAIA